MNEYGRPSTVICLCQDPDIRATDCPLVTAVIASIFASVALAACGGGGGSSNGGNPTGTVNVQMTDAPSCGFDHVYVTVGQVRINVSG